MILLNIGCGPNMKEGWVNLDIRKWSDAQDYVRSIGRGLPFSDGVVDEVLASHVLEHIEPGEELYFAMEEIWRVLRPEGRFWLIVPHSSSVAAFYPDHRSYWNEDMLRELLYGVTQHYGKFNFAIEGLAREGIELRATLTKKPL